MSIKNNICLIGCIITATMLCAPMLQAVTIPTVPSGHPRVYVRPTDIPELKAKINSSEFFSAWNTVKNSSQPLCKAFVYLVTDDEAAGRTAITKGLSAIQSTSAGRSFDTPFHFGACIYDWCYDLMTTAEKDAFIQEFKRVADNSDGPGYPAGKDSYSPVAGHSNEGWLQTGQLPVGIAIYDESKLMYDIAAKLYFQEFVPVRNFYYPGHAHYTGDTYLPTRFQHEQTVSWLFRRLGKGDIFSREQQFVPYQLIYNMRPDGQQIRSGDSGDDAGTRSNKKLISMLTASYYNDPYLMTLTKGSYFQGPAWYDHVFELLFMPWNIPKRPLSELPKTKFFADPHGEMVARTGWNMGVDSDDAVVQMRIGGIFYGGHQKKDFGVFQIYYKGPLAICTGLYKGSVAQIAWDSPHWRNYQHQSISQNSLLIYDPSEVMKIKRPGGKSDNDGGARWPNNGDVLPSSFEDLKNKYRMAQVTAHEFGPDTITPQYSYIAGDISQAYNANKIDEATRSMLTWNTGNATYPAVVVIFDRVKSDNASFKKTWLLHSMQQPTISNRTIAIVRDTRHYKSSKYYCGKLVTESLLPAQATMKKVGGPGKAFWVESTKKNYAASKAAPAEAGAWRVEVSPSTAAKSDRFLHVMTVMDKGTSSNPAVWKIQENGVVGASVLGRTVVFSDASTLLTSAQFTIQDSNNTKVLVCDLEPGTWNVYRNGYKIVTKTATSDGQCIYFNGQSGTYTLSRGRLEHLRHGPDIRH